MCPGLHARSTELNLESVSLSCREGLLLNSYCTHLRAFDIWICFSCWGKLLGCRGEKEGKATPNRAITLLLPCHEPEVQSCMKQTHSFPVQEGQSIVLELPKVPVCHQNWIMLEHFQENKLLGYLFNTVLIRLASSKSQKLAFPL